MKKNLLSLSMLMLSAISSGAMAATTTGQLNFNWSGVVPTSPVTSTAWAFVDGMNMPYTPGTEALNVSLDQQGDLTAVGVKPYDFFIVPVTGATTPGQAANVDKTKQYNSIKAFLGTAPISGGFVGNKQLTLSTNATANNGEVAVTLNGQALQIGDANATTLTNPAGYQAHMLVDVNAKAAATDVAEGSAISFSAPVIFAVDI